MTKNSILFIACFVLSICIKAQTLADSLKGFDTKHFQEHLANFKGTETERQKYIERVKRTYIDRKYKLGQHSSIQKNSDPSVQSSCTNIGFENGNTLGWTITGASQIMSGAGVDPFGNFPVVYPGGNYSLRLSDNNLSTMSFTSTATVVIPVDPTNSIFTLYYALNILDYPHDSSSASKFSIHFFDGVGNLIHCPELNCMYYEDALGGHSVGTTNFQQTWGSTSFPTSGPGVNLGGQQYPVTYLPWQTTIANLTPYLGQNVTCVISCSWCLYQYDWAYCYIDADCGAPQVTASNPLCAGGSTILSGPPGMSGYNWTGPVTGNTQNLVTSTPGNYTLTVTSVDSCVVGLPLTYSLSLSSGSYPILSIQTINDTICSGASDTLTVSGASTYTWSSNALNATTNTVSVAPLSNTTYTVTGYDSISACTNSSTIDINVKNCSSGITQSLNKSNNFTVYPNPANGTLTVDCKYRNAELFIYDILGNNIMQLHAEKEITNIDVSGLTKGVYFLNVKSVNGIFTKKFIVQR